MKYMTRRRFVALVAGAGGLVAFGGIPWWRRGRSTWPAAGPAGGLRLVRRNSYALGAAVSITALHARPEVARAAIEAALAELERIEEVMSLYRADSQIRRLNAAGRLDGPDADLVTVLAAAREMARRSDGAFDATVQPLWDVYDSARRAGGFPDEAQIAAARARVDWRRVEVSPERVQLGDGTAVTLNGIAQGFAADRVLAALRAHGVEHALVNTGEVGTLGQRATREPWTAGIQHPRRPDAYVSLARLDGRCMSTSGDYATTFSDDHTRHHIFDPATGRSALAFQSVTVLAATGMEADALSTAVFVLGPERGLDLIGGSPGADALFVLRDGRVMATAGFPAVS